MFTHPGMYLTTGCTLLLALMPVIYRLSCAIWLSIFTKTRT